MHLSMESRWLLRLQTPAYSLRQLFDLFRLFHGLERDDKRARAPQFLPQLLRLGDERIGILKRLFMLLFRDCVLLRFPVGQAGIVVEFRKFSLPIVW